MPVCTLNLLIKDIFLNEYEYTNKNFFLLLFLPPQAYHSTFPYNPTNDRLVGNFVIMPINTQFRGPAYPANSDYDIIDECLDLFRANSFFKNFEIKIPSDRLLIYGILFINDCLSHIRATTSYNDAVKTLTNLSLDDFVLPGTAGFPLNTVYQVPINDHQQMDLLKSYLTQFRQELSMRLIDRIYVDSMQNDVETQDKKLNKPSKFWLAFTKRKFMNKSL